MEIIKAIFRFGHFYDPETGKSIFIRAGAEAGNMIEKAENPFRPAAHSGNRYTGYGPARELREPGEGISREGLVAVEEFVHDGPTGMMHRGPASGAIRHVIDPRKSELYGGQERTYYTPFDRCDHVADYRWAWAFFEGGLGGGND